MKRVVVLTGGESIERGVSVASAHQVVNALRSRGHSVDVFDTARGPVGEDAETAYLAAGVDSLSAIPEGAEAGQPADSLAVVLRELPPTNYDVVFLALYGGLARMVDCRQFWTRSGFRTPALGLTLANN